MQKNRRVYTYSLAATALLTVIGIILGRFAIYIPLFGFPSVRFSLSAIPVFLVGALFGGPFGAISGITCDILSFLMASSGPYHPGFTLNSALIGLLPGLFFAVIRKYNIHFSFNIINSIAAVLALIGSFVYINFFGLSTVKDLVTIGGIPGNILLTVLVFIIIGALSFATYYIGKKHAEPTGLYTVDKIIFICIVNYLVIQLCLTPIWLFQLYGIPPIASVTVRLFKSTVDIPLQVTFIYLLIKCLPARIKGDQNGH